MKSISKLKDEARRYEQREEWEKAIAAYLQVLRTADEGETEVELPLYNRLGDLCLRLDKPQEAVRHYEQAADRYAEAGLYNNAIALCNKALRYSPDRLELIRKLGQFSASQGFITDARRYFLDYAERQFNAGKVSDALGALEDFANVSDDADVREMLGRQLQAHGRINDAVDELKRAHALRVRDGQTQEADAVRREILAIDPNATIEAGAAAPVSDARAATGPELPGLVEIEPERPAGPPSETREEVEGLETGERPGLDSDAIEPIQLTGFETADDSDMSDIDMGTAGVEGLETTSFDFDEVASETPTLEDLGLEREATSFDGEAGAGEADVFDLPTLDDPAAGFDLPTLDDPATGFDGPSVDDPDSPADLPLLDEPDTTDLPALDGTGATTDLPGPNESPADADLPAFDPPQAANRERLDDPDIIDLPDSHDDAFDLPLLGDDDPSDLADEAAPMRAPEFDDAPPVDPAPQSEEQDFGGGGDLPLDLSSLSGFDFSTPGSEEVDTPSWETNDSTFDIPELDGESLGLPSWEPPDDTPSFDLPSFDTDVEEPTGEGPAAIGEESAGEVEPPPVTDAPEGAPSGSPPAESVSDALVPDTTMYDEELPVVDIPAIELPTWDTGLGLEGMEPDAEAAGEESHESSEPSWLEPTADEDEEVSPDLPTFTYEDDTAEADEIPAEADEIRAADPAQTETVDDDPLGLAAHLAGRTPADGPATTRGTAQPLDSDWLDDVAEDDAGAALDDVTDGAADVGDIPLDTSTDDSESSADEAGLPAASVEDTGAAAARAADAANDMSDTHGVPPDPIPEPDVHPAETPRVAVESGPPPGDDYVDLGALVAGDAEEETTRFRVQETAPTGDEDRDFAELLSQFKSKVHQHLPPEDAAAHYDLGLAFKEMGLIDEAIGEFQVALRAGHMRLRVYEELGQCFLQKEQFNIAEKVLSRALTMKFDDELELLGVYYHLGRAYEALGRRDAARDAYERVLGMDINFGDVTDRIARL